MGGGGSTEQDRVETPYLQLVMTRLWHEEDGRRLDTSCALETLTGSAAPGTSSQRTSTRRSTR